MKINEITNTILKFSAWVHISTEKFTSQVKKALETYSKWYTDTELQKELYHDLKVMDDARNGVDSESDYIYTQTFDRDTVKQIQDEIFADPSKMQVDYIKTQWMADYFDDSAWKK